MAAVEVCECAGILASCSAAAVMLICDRREG
jgi:hypothetical protein